MDIQEVVASLTQIEHGFKHIMLAGDKIYASPALDHYAVAIGLLNEESYQGRMLGTYILGLLAPVDVRALISLREVVVRDENWRVQEMLAKAFDYYCAQIGYEHALADLESWLSDPDAKLNRAAIEGLRIWTGRSYFKVHPEVAVSMISAHRASESEYLRKSVGNALRDIWKRHPDLVEKEVSGWDLSDPKVVFTSKLATPALFPALRNR